MGSVRMRHASKRATMRISSFSIAMDDDGRIAAHHIECAEVRKMAEEGKPVMALKDGEKPLGLTFRRHGCLYRY